MKFSMDFGDTNFIGLVNADLYKSFVDEDWDLDMLLQHFSNEMKNGSIVICQMTEAGIEHSWKVEAEVGLREIKSKCFRKAEGCIKVTTNQLYLVDYDCLTMAAQFSSDKIPDNNCAKYKIDIENGIYVVEIIQFYNVDRNEYVGTDKVDIMFNFIKVPCFQPIGDKVLWCTF